LELDFEIPRNFQNPERYIPGRLREDCFEDVPAAVGSAIFDAIGVDVPLDPMTIFLYLRNGRLPQFVIAYFMEFELPKRKVTKMYRFYRALHLANMFRESVMVPQPHFMSNALDTVAVQAVGRRAGDEVSGGAGSAAEREVPATTTEQRQVPLIVVSHASDSDDDEEPVLMIDEDRADEEEEEEK